MAAEEMAPVLKAVEMGDVDEVARRLDAAPYLIEARVPSIGDETLLIVAAERGRAGVARLLLERGAEVNAGDSDGYTALHLAARGGHEEVVNLLLSSGADSSMKDGDDDDDDTALMLASKYGHLAVVRQLSRHMQGHGLDERDWLGRTALWFAFVRGHADVVRVLLLAGADHTIADNDDTTPLQIAQEEQHHECVALVQWWEGELQRTYVLHKARTLHDDTATRQQAPAAPVPAYLSARVQGGKRLPHMQIQASGGSGGRRTRAAARRIAERGEEEKDEEVCAMVGFVVKDLSAEMYIELLAGFHQ